MKRSGKFYRKNEREVMKSLGLSPTYNSGSGWIEKEDGQNDYIICQLKSTDSQSIKVNQKDLRMLENNAAVTHKLPVFAIQFLNTCEVWLLVKPFHMQGVSDYLNTGKIESLDLGIDLDNMEEYEMKQNIKIKSSGDAREQYKKEQEQRYNKTRSAI